MEHCEENRTLPADDGSAFERLMRRHGPMLARYIRFRIANPADAEDVLQETLLAVWLGLRRYCQPRFSEIAEFQVVLDESLHLVVNGVTFIHWYDTITSAAL